MRTLIVLVSLTWLVGCGPAADAPARGFTLDPETGELCKDIRNVWTSTTSLESFDFSNIPMSGTDYMPIPERFVYIASDGTRCDYTEGGIANASESGRNYDYFFQFQALNHLTGACLERQGFRNYRANTLIKKHCQSFTLCLSDSGQYPVNNCTEFR